jgi:hypothetical protein
MENVHVAYTGRAIQLKETSKDMPKVVNLPVDIQCYSTTRRVCFRYYKPEMQCMPTALLEQEIHHAVSQESKGTEIS